MKIVAILCLSTLLSACGPCDPDDETSPIVESTTTDTLMPARCEPFRVGCYTSPPSAAPPCDIYFSDTPKPWACDDNAVAPAGCQKTEFSAICPGSLDRTLRCCP